MRVSEHIKNFKKHIEILTRKGRFFGDVYRDWCECFALSLANNSDLEHGDRWRQREDRYLQIVSQYNKDEIREHFPAMCADLTMAFEKDPFQDHLGTLYMELFGEMKCKKKALGQCFTPIDLCVACAQIALGDNLDEIKQDTSPRVYTIADEAVGGGAMLIAACKVLYENGINYQRRIRFYAADLDPFCVHMCYIQLSLLGARAIVKRQDTISMRIYDTFTTPMEAMYPAFLLHHEEAIELKHPIPKSTKEPVIQSERQVISIYSLIEKE